MQLKYCLPLNSPATMGLCEFEEIFSHYNCRMGTMGGNIYPGRKLKRERKSRGAFSQGVNLWGRIWMRGTQRNDGRKKREAVESVKSTVVRRASGCRWNKLLQAARALNVIWSHCVELRVLANVVSH